MANPLLFVAVGGTVLLVAARRRAGRRHATRNDARKSTGRAPGHHEGRLQRIAHLLERFVADDPAPGFFYQVQPGDRLPDVAAAALGRVGAFSRRQLEQYVFCISSGPQWNVAKYGTPSVTKAFGNELLVPGLGKGVRVAFLPRNEDALDSMLQGRSPAMRVDPKSGRPRGDMFDAYGLLWLPPVDAGELSRGEISCAAFSWPDGSSSIDPPTELLVLLEAA